MLGLTERDQGRTLAPDEEKACQFPICSEPSEFVKFFEHGVRAALTSPDLREAMHQVQPFYRDEWAVELGYLTSADYAGDAEYNALCTLNKMSNVDKHRRVAVTLLWPAFAGWGSDTELEQRWRPGAGEFTDGEVLGYIRGDVHPAPELDYQFNLAVRDLLPTDPRDRFTFGSAADVVQQADA